ncbi:hypothetical protein ACHWQZ_G012449 [Mnemiopsis leidyi]
MSITGVTLEQIVDEKEIFLKLETHNHNIREETEIHLKAKVSYRRSISKSPTDYGSKDKLEFERKRGRTHRRFSETALMYLAEDYSTQLSNNEPRFIKSSTSLANSRNELDVYAEMNNYLDEESRGRCRRAQSVEMLALGEGEDEAGVEDPLSTVDNINLDMIREIQIGK